MGIKLTVVIPAYNEQATIKKTLDEIREILKTQKISYEILVVDDGSTDKTADIVKDIVRTDGVRLIQHPYNKGYGASLKTGAKNANGDYVLYIDADGQQDPRYIPSLLKEIDRYDMVVGARKNVYSTSLFRAPGKMILGIFANYLAERKIPDLNSGFRIIRKDIIYEFMDILPNTFSFTTTITLACIKSGYNVKYVPIMMKRRKGGKSVLNPLRDGFKFIMFLFRITMLFSPLRVFVPMSLFLFVFGFIELVIGIIKFFKVPSLSVILILSSVIIFFFGLLADQISMMRRETRK